MQITILGRDIRPPWNEAVKNMAYELAKQLALRGHSVHLVSDEAQDIPKSPNLEVHSIPRNSFTESAVKIILDLEHTGKTDLLHIQNLIIHRSLFHLVESLKEKSKLPIVSYCCQLPTLPIRQWLRILQKDPREAFSSKIGMLAPSFLANRAFKNVDMIVTSSQYLRRHLVDRATISNESSKVVYPFVSSIQDATRDPDTFEGSSRPTVLYLGSHRVLRGEDDFLHMLFRLKNKVPNINATLVTPHPIPRRIERLVQKYQLSDSLQFLARGIQLDFHQLLRQCNAYVFTGLPPVGAIDPPLTIIEALILGTPVASYDAGGISEVLPRQQLVPYGNIGKLVDRVGNLIDNNTNKNSVDKIFRPDLLEKYGSENAVRTFENFYEELA